MNLKYYAHPSSIIDEHCEVLNIVLQPPLIIDELFVP